METRQVIQAKGKNLAPGSLALMSSRLASDVLMPLFSACVCEGGKGGSSISSQFSITRFALNVLPFT